MKKIIFPMIMTIAAAAFAQDANPTVMPNNFQPVKVTKTKITCTADRIEKTHFEDGSVQDDVTTGKVSESIRTTWASGDTEYRFSDYKSFQNDGKDLMVVGKATAKIVTKKEGSKLTETTQSRSVVNYVNPDMQPSRGNLQERSYEGVSVYEVNGNERVLVSAIDDGKPSPTFGTRELEITLNEKQRVLRIVTQTPYTQEFEGLKIEVLKDEMNCLLEDVTK